MIPRFWTWMTNVKSGYGEPREGLEKEFGDMLKIRYVLHNQHHSETEVYAQLV